MFANDRQETASMAADGSDDVIWLRPDRASTGRPAQHSRDEITAAALRIADQEGLDAVSMRRVAAELGTGAASLYRYVETRDDLLDLMTDATASEYVLEDPAGDWLAYVLGVGEQGLAIMRRHPWLPSLVITRSVLGPHGLSLLEHVLEALADHPASTTAKLEAFAVLNATTAVFVLNELSGGSVRQQRNAAYLQRVLATGGHPRLAELLTPSSPAEDAPGAPPDAADRYLDIVALILIGLLDRAQHQEG
jgi:AcrR family transcriptional regulator